MGASLTAPGAGRAPGTKVIVFDVHGVLLDSIGRYRRAWLTWAAPHHIDEETIRSVAFGRRPVDTIGLVAPHLDADQEAGRFHRILCMTDDDDEPAVTGAVELVNQLPPGQWAVVTSGERQHVLRHLARAGMPTPPAAVFGDDVTVGKPDPGCYLTAARHLGVNPARCVVVEDAPAGITAAKTAGMAVVAVCTTHDRQQLAAADATFATLADAAEHLLAMALRSSPRRRTAAP